MSATIPLLRLSLLPTSPSLSSLHLRRTPPSLLRRLRPISAAYTPIPFPDRLISAAAYTLPLLNSLPLGRPLFARSQTLTSLFSPLLPILSLYHSVPFLPFLAFFALYLAVARNPSLSRFSRFNAMQAVMLDVALSLPHIVVRIFGVPGGELGFKVLETGYGAVFVLFVICWVYSFVMSVLGKTPFLPFVSGAVSQQIP